ncbi:Vps52-domain-containing protein [Metschnikowia bicuspidata var. bicuspidata NRRL YB-4993]|uniref:Vps52-domain-containing protein n=1 Tax=Metschnikowia bicuspidata var. bicuspidata NRRL YB-4993 TaxID=869754 RepID=A0A1A0HAT9_9ASCO|nr:Vps52-domain-containing protein [Metschnikowia bicuspidata var. bicuspidata NRRL YB-4993]OBA20997.1 Vps52-domain-containing protein [Metschnikowia bicuspidata var. bicuspidata NRRL YB-4993]
MSSPYLQSILPIAASGPPAPATPALPLEGLSEQDLGVLLAQFERFLALLEPYRDQLQPIERFLGHFDSQISRLSESLRALQAQAGGLAQGVDGHRSLVERLNPVVLDLVIPPAMAQAVLRGPVDGAWVAAVLFIADKQQLVRRILRGDAMPELKDLRLFAALQHGVRLLEAKAVERVRDHVIEQIRLLRRSAAVSSQAVQRLLLQVKDAFAFLKSRTPHLARQLHGAYVYTMKWYYTTRFAKYLHSLQKLRVKHIDLLYVLGGTGGHEPPKPGLLDFMGAGHTPPSPAQTAPASAAAAAPPPARVSLPEYYLSVAKRMAVLADDGAARRAIPSQIAETTPFAYWLEFAFQQFANALLDNVVVEYLFATDFFYQGSEKPDAPPVLDPALPAPGADRDWAHAMFAEVFSMGHSYASWLVSSPHPSPGPRLAGTSGGPGPAAQAGTCDAFAVLLMIRIVQKQNAMLHNQFHVPVMEDYHNRLLLLLWPHFTRIIDINCDALKRNIVGSGPYAHAAAGASHAPIQTTQQFAQLLLGLFKLAFPGDDAAGADQFLREPLRMSITRLRNDFEGALTRASTYIFGTGKGKAAHREMFLFNNYFLLVTILGNEFEATPNPFIQEQIEHFQLLCDAYKPK